MSKSEINNQIDTFVRPHDKGKHFSETKKAAHNGNINAQFDLASLYKNGEETERSLEKAFYWYHIAAENDFEAAQYNLALSYENGEGTEKNLEKVFDWYQKSAENGNIQAQYKLALLYHNRKR